MAAALPHADGIASHERVLELVGSVRADRSAAWRIERELDAALGADAERPITDHADELRRCAAVADVHGSARVLWSAATAHGLAWRRL